MLGAVVRSSVERSPTSTLPYRTVEVWFFRMLQAVALPYRTVET